MVPGTRIELVQAEARGILSPLRLPVPPPGQIVRLVLMHLPACVKQNSLIIHYQSSQS